MIVWNGGVFYLWLYRVGVILPKLPTPLPKTNRFPLPRPPKHPACSSFVAYVLRACIVLMVSFWSFRSFALRISKRMYIALHFTALKVGLLYSKVFIFLYDNSMTIILVILLNIANVINAGNA